MGRYYGLGRDTIEETSRLSIDDLRIWDCLHEGFSRKFLTLKRGDRETGSLSIEVHIKDPWSSRSYIKFDYKLDGKPVTYEHEIELFPCYFGSHRFYFRCRYCRRRVTALYLSGGYYACRHCQRLAYEVSQKHRTPFEILNRALNLENRASERRKHGHPRKANRLLWRAYKFNRLGLMDLQARYGSRQKINTKEEE